VQNRDHQMTNRDAADGASTMSEIQPMPAFEIAKGMRGFLIFFVLAGCGSGESKRAAEAIADQLYLALSKQDWETAKRCYGPEFFQKVTPERWQKLTGALTGKLGSYESHRLRAWRFHVSQGTRGSRKVTILIYQVKYSKAITTETLTFATSGTDGQLRIQGHRINSPALLEPVDVTVHSLD
jgi:hypothetical protein